MTTPTNPSEWMIDFGRKLDELGMKDPRLALEIATHVQTLLHHNTEDIIDRAIALSDKIEAANETAFDEWRGFKHFRNTLRDMKAALKPTHKV